MPADLFFNVLVPLARHMYAAPCATSDDAAALHRTVAATTFFDLYSRPLLRYGSHCFGHEKMSVVEFRRSFVAAFDFVVFKFASTFSWSFDCSVLAHNCWLAQVCLVRARTLRVLKQVGDISEALVQNTFAAFSKDVSLHNALAAKTGKRKQGEYLINERE